jgi:hypothetical protein
MSRAKQRFDSGILRIKNLDSIYLHLVQQLRFSKEDVSDILRSEIVYAISAFDRLIHDLVREGCVDIFSGNKLPTSSYKNIEITLDQLEQINNSTFLPPEAIFENILIQKHKHLSFQDPEKITSGLSLIWNETHKWQKVALAMQKTEGDVKIELKNIVIRRNQIVHEGDIDMLTGQIQSIEHSAVQESVNFIEKLGTVIYGLL